MDSNTTARSRVARAIAAGGIVAISVLAPTAAFGGGYGSGDPDTGSSGGDGGNGTSKTGSSGGNSSDSLPLTGGDVLGITLIGAGALAGGTASVRANKRRVVAEV